MYSLLISLTEEVLGNVTRRLKSCSLGWKLGRQVTASTIKFAGLVGGIPKTFFQEFLSLVTYDSFFIQTFAKNTTFFGQYLVG